MSMVFNPKWKITGRTMVWQLNANEWVRHLVRRTSGSKSYWSSLVHVEANRPVCLACLGQVVTLEPSDEYPEGVLHCHVCGARYGFL